MSDPREDEGVNDGAGSAATVPRAAAAPRHEVRGEERVEDRGGATVSAAWIGT
jgi:hypothetical protein